VAARKSIVETVSPDLGAVLHSGSGAPPLVTVRDLVDAGGVTMMRSRRLDPALVDTGTTPLVRQRDLHDDFSVVPTGKVDLGLLDHEVELTVPGDVLISATGGLRTAVVDVGGAVVAAPVHILRCHGRWLHPLALAALLASAANRSRGAGSNLRHFDIYGLAIPHLDGAATRRLADLVGGLLDQRRRARALMVASDEVLAQLIDGVGSGMLAFDRGRTSSAVES
jgi:hypothetical protein